MIREKVTLVIPPDFDYSRAAPWELDKIMRNGTQEQIALARPVVARRMELEKSRKASFKKRAEAFVEELTKLSEKYDMQVAATTEYDSAVLYLDDGCDYDYARLLIGLDL